MVPCFPYFVKLPPERQDEVWAFHLTLLGMSCLYFAVQGTLDTVGTHAIYATRLLQDSVDRIQGHSRVNRRAYDRTRRLLPDTLLFYNRRKVNADGQVHIYDMEESLQFQKQTDVVYFRYFTPLHREEVGGSDAIAYQLRNLPDQVQKAAVEEHFATSYSRQCVTLLENLKELKTVFVGMTTSSGGGFLSLRRQLLITSTTGYYIWADHHRTPVLYCWPASSSQSTILELFERFRIIRDAAIKGKWELLLMAVFEGDDALEWYARLNDSSWLAQEYGLRVYQDR